MSALCERDMRACVCECQPSDVRVDVSFTGKMIIDLSGVFERRWHGPVN